MDSHRTQLARIRSMVGASTPCESYATFVTHYLGREGETTTRKSGPYPLFCARPSNAPEVIV